MAMEGCYKTNPTHISHFEIQNTPPAPLAAAADTDTLQLATATALCTCTLKFQHTGH
jgi:hypothetical protein